MAQVTSPGEVIRFGAFELDVSMGELRERGVRLSIQGLPLQILAILAGKPGSLVTREELRTRLWPADTFVDFDHSIRNAVARLREALHDSAEHPRYIETLPRRGYRFIAQVASPPSNGASPAPPQAAAGPGLRLGKRGCPRRRGGTACVGRSVDEQALSMAAGLLYCDLGCGGGRRSPLAF